MFQGHRSIPVLVKHKDGSREEYSVFSRNILHKTVVKRSPKEIRESLLKSGSIKCADVLVTPQSQTNDGNLDTAHA